jgi:hypothetical protein
LCCRQRHPAGGPPPCSPLPLIRDDRASGPGHHRFDRRLAQFYGALLNVEPQPGRLALHAWIATALELGATVDDPPRQEPFGAEAWLLDPEGNRLLLLVWPAL